MATFFRSATDQIVGTTEVLLVTAGASSRLTVIGLSLTNMTESIVMATIRIEESSTTTYFIKDVIIPPNQSLRAVNGGEKLIIPPSGSLYVVSNTPDSLDVVMSYVEIV